MESHVLICFILFDAGFRSRVKYISVLDPTNMSYYVSEILDAGLAGPLFMVITNLKSLVCNYKVTAASLYISSFSYNLEKT